MLHVKKIFSGVFRLRGIYLTQSQILTRLLAFKTYKDLSILRFLAFLFVHIYSFYDLFCNIERVTHIVHVGRYYLLEGDTCSQNTQQKNVCVGGISFLFRLNTASHRPTACHCYTYSDGPNRPGKFGILRGREFPEVPPLTSDGRPLTQAAITGGWALRGWRLLIGTVTPTRIPLLLFNHFRHVLLSKQESQGHVPTNSGGQKSNGDSPLT